jgi:hypothetical protein
MMNGLTMGIKEGLQRSYKNLGENGATIFWAAP